MDMARSRSNSRRGAYVLAVGESADHSVAVAVDALDVVAAGCAPTMLKIDVEGFEANVVAGASGLLAQRSLQAVLIELNGLGARYGFAALISIRACWKRDSARRATHSLPDIWSRWSSTGPQVTHCTFALPRLWNSTYGKHRRQR